MTIPDIKYRTAFNFGEVFTHDELVFEGIERPATVLSFHEAGVGIGGNKINSAEDILVLERYFSDLQNLFMKKLLAFASDTRVSSVESVKLRSLLDEMITVKELIEKASDKDGEEQG